MPVKIVAIMIWKKLLYKGRIKVSLIKRAWLVKPDINQGVTII